MSLTGNLEDLPLLDILQIVSFSKKTGYLSIEAGAGRGAIVFDRGFVVAAFTWETPPLDPRARTLEIGPRDVILRARIEMALEHLIRLREGLFDFSLTDHAPLEVAGRDIEFELLSQGINAQELLLDLARGMDEDRRNTTAAVEASFVEAGTDDMDAGLADLLTPPPLPSRRPAPETLDELVAETAPELEFSLEPPPLPRARASQTPVDLPRPGDPTRTLPLPAPAPAPTAAAAPAAVPAAVVPPAAVPAADIPAATAPSAGIGAFGTILLVDDEEEVRRVLGAHFSRAGYTVAEAEDPDGAVRKGSALAKAGTDFLLVVDLGMPTTGGTSFHGGLEAVRKLARAGARPPVLMMTESLGAPIQARAKEMGIRIFVFKPGLSKLDPEQFAADLEAFAAKIVADVLPRLARPAPVSAPVPAPVPVPDTAVPVPVPVPELPAPVASVPVLPAPAPCPCPCPCPLPFLRAPRRPRPHPRPPPTSSPASSRCWGSASTTCAVRRTRRRSRPW